MDRLDLIARLNADLAHEYAAIIRYRTFASLVRGPHRPALRPLFVAEIADEVSHAGILADAIAALGGVPTTTVARVSMASDPLTILQCILETEEAAIARYVDRRGQAAELNEHGLVVLLDGMIADETHHRNEIRLVLADWEETAAAPERAPRPPEPVRASA
jgi:bacterioferritin